MGQQSIESYTEASPLQFSPLSYQWSISPQKKSTPRGEKDVKYLCSFIPKTAQSMQIRNWTGLFLTGHNTSSHSNSFRLPLIWYGFEQMIQGLMTIFLINYPSVSCFLQKSNPAHYSSKCYVIFTHFFSYHIIISQTRIAAHFSYCTLRKSFFCPGHSIV